jgi:hypothetical protein
MTTFSRSLTNLTTLLPQSHDCSCHLSRWIQTGICVARLQKHTHMRQTSLRIVLTCDFSLGSLTLLAHEAGDFVRLILLCITWSQGQHDPVKRWYQCIEPHIVTSQTKVILTLNEFIQWIPLQITWLSFVWASEHETVIPYGGCPWWSPRKVLNLRPPAGHVYTPATCSVVYPFSHH